MEILFYWKTVTSAVVIYDSNNAYRYKLTDINFLQVVFQFACGIEKTLADRLDSLGIIVSGRRLGNSELLLQEGDCVSANDDDDDLQTCVSKRYADVHCSIVNSGTSSVINCNHDDQKLNLDVTAMLAYVSGLTNGRCNFKFKEPVLTQQAEWERAKPVKPVLDQLFEGMEW